MCDNGPTTTNRPRVLGKEYRGWGRGRMGRLASVTQNATEHMSRRAGRAGREAHAGNHMGDISGVLGWQHFDEICDVSPGGLAGCLLRLSLGSLRLRGGKDAHLLLSDGHNY